MASDVHLLRWSIAIDFKDGAAMNAGQLAAALKGAFGFVTAKRNPLTGVLEVSAGSPMLMGTLTSGVWFPVGSLFRLLMTGTGTVTIDSKDALGTITTGVYTTTLTGATNEIGFPYAGDAAVQIRATLTGSATAKVI